MSYFDELSKAMKWLGEQPDTVFLGQSVAYPGNAVYKTLADVTIEKRVELPVAEDMQMGMSIGLSFGGKVPVTIYPRMNFLVCAMNQLMNHLDKIERYSNGQFKPKVIIRTCVGSETPLDPGIQHKGEVPLYLETIPISRLKNKADIFKAYWNAYFMEGSTLLIEYADLYNT